jgi:RNA polymerase sigma-70 factor (ECF subfamily)
MTVIDKAKCTGRSVAVVHDMTNAFDESLADRFPVSRDESEFEVLFLEHYPRILRVLMRLTGDRAQAEELSNEVFWRLSRQPQSWLLTTNVAPWLYRIAVNLGIDAFRTSAKRARYESDAARDGSSSPPQDGPLDSLLRKENRIRVQQVLVAMKPVRARLLLLRSCGASYKDLAESLDLSVASVGTLLTRSDTEFRKKYLALTAKETAK